MSERNGKNGVLLRVYNIVLLLHYVSLQFEKQPAVLYKRDKRNVNKTYDQ